MNLKFVILAYFFSTPTLLYSEHFFVTGDLADLIPLHEKIFPNVGKITVLTQPINARASQDIQGHFGVTSSVLHGFQKLNIPMNYNPQRIDEVGDHIVVLVNIDALYQAIELKRAGRIKTLIVGPNILSDPAGHNHILGSSEIDWYIAPCDWARTCNCEEEPLIQGKTAIWYVGVDVDYWTPNYEKSETKTMLVYWKTGPESFCNAVEGVLHKNGWKTKRIRYGDYNLAQYKQLLNEVDAATFISQSESQGIALASVGP